MKKVAFFFGAGAEIAYGLPSGGKFAIDIFRMDATEDKKELKDKRAKINKRSNYARNWLPEDFDRKPISSFGRAQYEGLVKSSLEYKRYEIIDYLDNFDDRVSALAEKFSKVHGRNVVEAFEDVLEIPFGDETFGHEVKISKKLGDYNGLFSSKFFSSYLKLVEQKGVKVDPHFSKRARSFCRAILELLIGSCGEDLVRTLNDGIFEKKPDDIDIFDDLGSIFSLDYRGAGLTGLEMLLDYDEEVIGECESNSKLILIFSMKILEDVFSRSLDYQSLIDSNWRYLYSPKTDWAKFCKINIFLHTAKRYISGIAEEHREKVINGNGYYHDVVKAKEIFEVSSIGTTNYNTFIESITEESVYFLNGSVEDFYDPYLNSIIGVSSINGEEHFVVPFLFTQSGVKPLTSIKMSKRYVDLYENLKASDEIFIVGYGFNADDGHINGMFRSLIESEGKKITIFHFVEDFDADSDLSLIYHYCEKLRLSENKGVRVIKVDADRKSRDELLWYEQAHIIIQEEQE